MAAGNSVKLTFAGDSASLDRTFARVGSGAKDMAQDLDKAGDETKRFGGAVAGMNDKIDASESKFMGAADLVDGLAGAFGVSLGPTVEYARAFGDMAGGFTATLGPAMESISGKLGKLSIVTKVQAGAQAALNAVMNANPIFFVVAALVALTAGFIIAYKKSETFRNIVNGAMAGVRSAVDATWSGMKKFFGYIESAVTGSAKTLAKVADIITTPYQIAFRAIASLWNNTIGRLSFSIPGWVPGIGGNGFDVPDIPMLAKGGVAQGGMPHIVGEQGPELFVPGMTGTVVPNNALGGGGQLVVSVAPGAGQDLLRVLRFELRTSGGTL